MFNLLLNFSSFSNISIFVQSHFHLIPMLVSLSDTIWVSSNYIFSLLVIFIQLLFLVRTFFFFCFFNELEGEEVLCDWLTSRRIPALYRMTLSIFVLNLSAYFRCRSLVTCCSLAAAKHSPVCQQQDKANRDTTIDWTTRCQRERV